MEQHSNPIIAIALSVASFFGLMTMHEFDLLSGIALKWVSIFAFAVTGMYTLWQWRIKYLNNKNKIK